MNVEIYFDYVNYYYRKMIAINWRYVAIVILALLALFGIFRACSSTLLIGEHYRIGYDTSWYPLQLMERERGMSAFMSELFSEIAKGKKMRLELVQSNQDFLVLNLNNKEFDGILSAMTPTPSNRYMYDFSDPIYLLGPIVVVKSSSNIKTLKDLQYKNVGIKTISPAIQELKTYAEITTYAYDNMLTALSDLEKGNVDAVLIDPLQAQVYLSGFANRLKVVAGPLSTLAIRLVVRKDEKEFLKRFNEGLKEMKENGDYKALLKRWNLP